MRRICFNRSLPEKLEGLVELALDLRWTWSHAGDRLWSMMSPEIWARTQNPWLLLQSISGKELNRLTRSRRFMRELDNFLAARHEHFGMPGWFKKTYPGGTLGPIAYFSMEFGVGEALPLYAGGLGVLAGDYLKTGCDLEVPLVGVGLLYQEGYFRQAFNSDGWQMEAYPYNDPAALPICAVTDTTDGLLRIPLELPGRKLWLRAWQAQVGRVNLYLLDTNDPLNNPFDRGITGKLYPDRPELRLMQEMVLGIGGSRTLKMLGIDAEIYHLNEGHAAFAVVERARNYMQHTGESFEVALCAMRAGNVFTTHTPVAAGFDSFSSRLVAHHLQDYLDAAGISTQQLLALGRKDPNDEAEPFNMAFLATRGSIAINGVSRLHGKVSQHIFQPLFPRWPEAEIPVKYVTNGVHMPSWDSADADELWTKACGKDRWLHTLEHHIRSIESVPDTELWAMRQRQRHSMVDFVRRKLTNQLKQRGASSDRLREAETALDGNVLTLGFARRFTAYKRPNLLLTDPERLAAMIANPKHPLQLIIAGKAHPADEEGKRLLQQFANFAERTDVHHRVVLLEDYDIATAQQLVQGVDLWLNTPKRPWEACGTSGMKVLVNGGLNISELDGWWAEAYAPHLGWALGDGQEHTEPDWDARESAQLCELIEKEIVPEFYDRDGGLPGKWVARVRASMSHLALGFSSNQMLREYVESFYIPTAKLFRQRCADGGFLAKEIYAWQTDLGQHWGDVRFVDVKASQANGRWQYEVEVHFGRLNPSSVSVELYAEPLEEEKPTRIPMVQSGTTAKGYVYRAEVQGTRPIEHYTPRIITSNPFVCIPLENSYILWQK